MPTDEELNWWKKDAEVDNDVIWTDRCLTLIQALLFERSQSSQDKAMIEDLVYRLDKEREGLKKWKDQAFLEIKAGNAGRELILELQKHKKVLIEFVLWASPCGQDETGPQPTHKLIGELARAALKKVK